MTSTPASAAASSPHEPQTIGMVWAQTPGGVIASNGDLPWDVPEDFAHFRATVRGHGVIMGRATWDSMPPTLQPMPRSQRRGFLTGFFGAGDEGLDSGTCAESLIADSTMIRT